MQVVPSQVPGHDLEDDFHPQRALVRSILFPSDLSPASDRAFEHARLLAERFDALLALCHFVDASRYAAPVRDELLRRAQAAALDHLDRLGEGLDLRHLAVAYETSNVGRALVRHIQATQPSLVVMATHGRSGLAHLLLGSVAETVVRTAGRPVLCVREPEHGVALPYRRILVPTDLTAASRRAFPLAERLALAFGAELVVVHVAAPPAVASLTGIPDLVERRVPSPREVLDFVASYFAGLPLTVRVPWGRPEEGVLATAHAEKADLIVMSTRGHDSLGDRLRGSHTERVVRLSPCPVLAI